MSIWSTEAELRTLFLQPTSIRQNWHEDKQLKQYASRLKVKTALTNRLFWIECTRFLPRCLLNCIQSEMRTLLVSRTTEPSVQLDFESGTICWRTSDSRTCYTAVSGSRWRRFYLDSRTNAQCEYPFNGAVWIPLCIKLRFRDTLAYWLTKLFPFELFVLLCFAVSLVCLYNVWWMLVRSGTGTSLKMGARSAEKYFCRAPPIIWLYYKYN